MLYSAKGIDKLLETGTGDRTASKDRSIASDADSDTVAIKEGATTRNHEYAISGMDLRKYITTQYPVYSIDI